MESEDPEVRTASLPSNETWASEMLLSAFCNTDRSTLVGLKPHASPSLEGLGKY